MKFTWKYRSGIAFSQSVERDHENCINKDVRPNNNYPVKMQKSKRIRSAFTTDQINSLETEFKKTPYIGSLQRKALATILKISDRSVKVWFQNRRMKEKRDSNSKDKDEDVICISPIVDTKKELSNVGSNQSTNDKKERSLPILINTHITDMDIQVIGDKPSSNYLITSGNATSYKDSMNIQNLATTKKEHTPNTIPKRTPENDSKTTTEYSIGLSKRHKASSNSYPSVEEENISHPKAEMNKKQRVNCNGFPRVPEDLTSHERGVVSPTPPIEQQAPHAAPNPEYIPVVPNFYPQPYMPPGGLIWNPINVMPVMSTAPSAVTFPSGHNDFVMGHSNTISRVDCACNCNCHMKSHPVPMAYHQSHHGPQFVFTAVPLQNNNPPF